MTDKALSAIIRQERAMQEVAILKRDIGQALAACPVSVELGRWDTSNTRRAELTDPNGWPKTHIWQALNFTDIGGHGYPVRLDMREIADFLADADECEHCQRAWALILKRKEVRQELGAAKRAIRSLGRAALKREPA
ncbi:hypothetical protein ACNJYG_06840 [Pseudomonas sp. GW6]